MGSKLRWNFELSGLIEIDGDRKCCLGNQEDTNFLSLVMLTLIFKLHLIEEANVEKEVWEGG